MSSTLLPALRINDHHAIICVRVTRKWEYRGPTDNGPIQHIDLVLADQQGNAMYAEIPRDIIDQFNSQIEESNVYVISRFRTAYAKDFYRVVDQPRMIYFTVYTKIAAPKNPPTTFPRHVYKLTPFDQLPMLVGNFKNFIDVLAIIIEIGDIEMTHSGKNQQPTSIRKLVLRDASGLETKMTLWGQRAQEFSIDRVYNIDEAKPVITLFVGCLMKTYFKQDTLTGSSACKWYFNPNIPEAEELYKSYEDQRIEIKRVAPSLQQQLQPQPAPQLELKYLRDLQTINPYEFPENGCQCTVTIARLVPDASWWFPSCIRCGKTSSWERNGYICYSCDTTNYRHKYKLQFVATDGTGEVEMICFGQIAQLIVGKPVEQVMRTVRRDEEFPPDIAAIITKKYTFAITISNHSFYTHHRSFVVNSIIEIHARDRSISEAGASSSTRQIKPYRGYTSPPVAPEASTYRHRATPPPYHRHRIPSSSPMSTQISSKDAPPIVPIDTPISHPAKRELTYDNTDNDQESGDDECRNPKLTRVEGTTDSTEEHYVPDQPAKSKPNSQKGIETRTSHSQKHK